MTPNKPIGTAKVELPEMWPESYFMKGVRLPEAACQDHIRRLQAYIQQPSPLLEEARLRGANEMREIIRKALDADGIYLDGTVNRPTEELLKLPVKPSSLVDENRRLKEKADDYERALKEIAQGRPADAKWCFNRARQALAQPETKGEG